MIPLFFFELHVSERKKDVGVVADLCPLCGEVRIFVVSAHYRVLRMYFWIPLGRGKLTRSTRSCATCGFETACDPREYAEVLDGAGASGLSPEQVLARTNPRQEDCLRERRRLEAAGIDPQEQERRRTEKSIAFVRWAAQRSPAHAGCAVGMLSFIVLTVLPLLLWTVDSAGKMMAFAGVALVAAFVLYVKASRFRFRRWFERRFVPEGAARGVDFLAITDFLKKARGQAETEGKRILDLAAQRDLLVEVLVEEGILRPKKRA